MNWILMLWPMAAAACLTLAFVHFGVWLRRRDAWANLLFAVAAIASAGLGVFELLAGQAETTARYARIVCWAFIPCWLLVASLIGFVRVFFGTGRNWLALGSLGLWTLTVIVNFLPGQNGVYSRMTGLTRVQFGGATFVIGEGVPNLWNMVNQLGSLLMLAFVADASVALWRQGRKRRAFVVGGSIVFFVLVAALHSALIERGLIRIPYMVAFSFLAIVLAMSAELSRDLLRAIEMNRLLQQSEAELRENNESMTLAASAARLALWRWDVARDVIWTSDEGRALFGVPAGEVVTFARFLETLHPDDREPTTKIVRRCLEEGGEFRLEYRAVLPGGAQRWFAVQGRRSNENGDAKLLGVSVDVTVRKQEQERFHQIVELSPNGVVLTNSEGVILLVNRRTEAIFGYGRDELLGQRIGLLIPDHVRLDHAACPVASRGDPFALSAGDGSDLFGRRKDGTEFPVEIGISPFESPDGALILNVITDISPRRKAEAETAQLQMELAHLTRVTTLSELAGSMAHELNQPLTAILSNAQAAQRFLNATPVDMDEVRDILKDIADEDHRASEIINRMRAMMKKGEAEMMPRDINEKVRQTLALIQGDLLTRNISISLQLSPRLPLANGDRVQLQQVILNLILNGCDAMNGNPTDERRLNIETTRESDDMIRVSVSDRGVGIAPGLEEKIFEPFYSTKSHGLGMGLPICRSIIIAHGGRLWATNNPDRGATFHFTLKVAGSEPA